MGTRELQAIKSEQKDMLDVQSRNWRFIAEHFEVFQRNIHALRDCRQHFFI